LGLNSGLLRLQSREHSLLEISSEVPDV
jgi:hypothetical protein